VIARLLSSRSKPGKRSKLLALNAA
jgi:hypothetical protein